MKLNIRSKMSVLFSITRTTANYQVNIYKNKKYTMLKTKNFVKNEVKKQVKKKKRQYKDKNSDFFLNFLYISP